MQVRFLFPVLPLFNIAAATGAVRLYQNRRKGPIWAGLGCMAAAFLGGTAIATLLMTAVSHYNYPGGHALARLHAVEAPTAAQALNSGTSQSLSRS